MGKKEKKSAHDRYLDYVIKQGKARGAYRGGSIKSTPNTVEGVSTNGYTNHELKTLLK